MKPYPDKKKYTVYMTWNQVVGGSITVEASSLREAEEIVAMDGWDLLPNYPDVLEECALDWQVEED